ncbi:MAG: ABC transporter ATP-binding protein [Alistipes sp.]|nr:ABC transporter ATP-binding protein [Alistipes sp.]
MIALNDIELSFGSRTLIKHATTLFTPGLTALLGRNGSGKSTLLRAMASLGKAQSGTITLDGADITTLSTGEIAHRLAYVNTERVAVDTMRAYDLVAMGRAPYTGWSGRLKSHDHACVEHAITLAGVEHLANRYVETLSDGEYQRVMIARALAQDTPTILLDEPTSYLDMPNRYELCSLLARLAHDEHKCIIFSTHELDIALTLADTIALVDTPQLLHMPTEEMIASGAIERLFNSEHVGFDASTRSIRMLQR